MKTHRKFIPLSGIAVALSLAITGAGAQAQVETQASVVRYTDLDLTHDEGVASLDRRLVIAVRRVCGPAPVKDLRALREANECREAAWMRIQPRRMFVIAQAHDNQRGLASRDTGASIQVASSN